MSILPFQHLSQASSLGAIADQPRVVGTARRPPPSPCPRSSLTPELFPAGKASWLGVQEAHLADGVALAAIQALYQLTKEKDQKIDQLSRKLDALRAELAQLKQALK